MLRGWSASAAIALLVVFLGGASYAAAATREPLPNGRAYELVSPAEKNDNDAEPGGLLAFGGVAGEGDGVVAYASFNALPGSEAGPLTIANVARRGPGGWTSTSLAPPNLNQEGTVSGLPVILSSDLDGALMTSKANITGDAKPGLNLFVRSLSRGSIQLATPLPGEEFSFPPEIAVGASNDFRRVFFRSELALTPDSPAPGFPNTNLFEWREGTLRNVGILPAETLPAPTGVLALKPALHPVSEDGSRVVFGAEVSGVAQLFLREGAATTVEVSRSAPGVVDPFGPKPATFVGAAADGSSVYFTSAATLTADADTGENGGGVGDQAPNLYRYDVATGTLADLTVDHADPLGAQVGNALVAPGGSVAYFVAASALAPGATAGAPNLYRWSATAGTAFIATLAPGDPITLPGELPRAATNRSGSAIAFTSTAGLAGHPEAAGIPQIYHYSEAAGLACASCGGGPAAVGATIAERNFQIASGGVHPVSADGSKVFFETPDSLVPADSNGLIDTYEWSGAAPHLISSGAGGSDSIFVDASPSGQDVYFSTRDRLLSIDRDENTDVYDARVGGGFPLPAPVQGCEGESCRPPSAAPPAPPQLGSQSFNGPPNPTVRKPARKHRHHRHKRHHRKHCEANRAKCPTSHRRDGGQR